MSNKDEIEFKKYEKYGPHHIKESKRSIFWFNANQGARFDLVLKHLGEVEGKTVLDLGCGDGALTRLICKKKTKVIGVDNQELGLKFAKEILDKEKLKAELILADVCDLPLADNSADFVVASEVIEHIREPEKLVKEIYRVLKPCGKAIITTPYRLTEKPMDQYHYREFYPGEMREMFLSYFNDIEIIETHPALWFCFYGHWLRLPIIRNIHKLRSIPKYLVNFSALYLKRNPFLRDSSDRKKREFFTQILVKAVKK